MTAQDIDLREFSSDDLKNLRDKIGSSSTKQAAAKVCLSEKIKIARRFLILNRIVPMHFYVILILKIFDASTFLLQVSISGK